MCVSNCEKEDNVSVRVCVCVTASRIPAILWESETAAPAGSKPEVPVAAAAAAVEPCCAQSTQPGGEF